jgi:hypothetical protein
MYKGFDSTYDLVLGLSKRTNLYCTKIECFVIWGVMQIVHMQQMILGQGSSVRMTLFSRMCPSAASLFNAQGGGGPRKAACHGT